MSKILLNLFIWLHSFSYKATSVLVIHVNNGLHPKHQILNYYEFFTKNISPADTVLDISHGNGAVAYDISQKAKMVTGIDIEEKNI